MYIQRIELFVIEVDVPVWAWFYAFCFAGILLLHVVPFVYDKYEDVIDHHARKAADMANVQYKKLDDAVLQRIPRAPAKEKKVL